MRIFNEITPLKNVLENCGDLHQEVSKWSTRVNSLYIWKASVEVKIKSLQTARSRFDKVWDGLSPWKHKSIAGLPSHRHTLSISCPRNGDHIRQSLIGC